MRHFYLLVLVLAGAAALAFSSCVKAPELTLTGPASLEISADGGSGSITFKANREWSVRSSDSWVSVTPSSGSASDGTVTLSIRCFENTTYEDRTATVTITMEELSQTVTVKQPANLGIVIPTQSFNLASDARSIEVEVRANVQYSVSVSDNWIKQTGTKGLTTNKLTFSVEENDTYDGRSATITIKPQNATVQEQAITVKQAQKDALIVKDTSFDMPYGGGEIEVKVEANVSFDVKPNVDWIHYVETKALSGSTVRLKVDENPTYSAREGKIEIKQKNGTLSHTLAVKQAGRIAVTSIELNKTSLTLKEGESETLTATVKPDNATDKTVTWSSSAPNIATVDEAGNVTAIAKGEATITAQAGEKTAKCTVSVYKEIPVASIELDKNTLSLVVGDEVTLKATVKPDDATDKTITWTSSNANIASVDENGKVVAVAKGNATITAKAGDKETVCKVFIKAADYKAPSGAVDLGLSVVWAEKNLDAASANEAGGYYLWGDPSGTGVIMFFETPNTNYICDTQYDIAKAKLGKGWRLPTREELNELMTSCTWTKESNGVKLTGPNGQSISLPLSGMAFPADGAIGNTSITSKSNGYLMTGESYADGAGRFAYVYHFDQSFSYNWSSYNAPMAKFPVRPVFESLDGSIPVSSITLNKTELTMIEGDSETLTATVKPDDATDKTVNWYSSDVTVVLVDSKGIVTAWGEGTATVKAKQGAVASAPCVVTVKKKGVAVTEISLNKANLELAIGDSETLVATIKPEDATETVTWFSSDASVAAVDENGKVTAINTGTAAIIARVGEYTAACAVTVHEATIKVTSISLNKSSLTLSEGASETLVATIYPSNATEKVYWGTTSPAIATVDSDGKVTGIKSGSATISVIAGEKMASCEVTVVPEAISVTSVALDQTSLTLQEGESFILKATVKPDDATDKSVIWSSSAPAIAKVNTEGKVTALSAGSATITAMAGEKSATCSVLVSTVQVPEGAVDLGVMITRRDGSTYKLFWGQCNLGANNPSEEGDHYAWGETETKKYYDWTTYKWAGKSDLTFTKYGSGKYWAGEGTPDNKMVLDLEDDAAHLKLGGKWRIPTIEELMELKKQCTWTWTSQNGVNGYIVKRKDGHSASIFLPVAEYSVGRNGTNPQNVGYYCSSSLRVSYNAYYLYFTSKDVSRYDYHRYYGFVIRPVSE